MRMTTNTPACPQCSLEETHLEGGQYVCDTCGYEWPADAVETPPEDATAPNPNAVALADGAPVPLVKALKAKGPSTPLKGAPKTKTHPLRAGAHAGAAGG